MTGGFGTTPFGLFFGSGSSSETPEPVVISDQPNAVFNQTYIPPSQVGGPAYYSPLLADSIDPATGDFSDVTTGSDIVDSTVVVAITTTRASGASVRNVGLRLSESKLGTSFSSITESDIKLALSQLVENRDISILDITTQTNDDDASAWFVVTYLNLRSLDPKPRSLKLSASTSNLRR